MRFELTTTTLATWCSTPELLPHPLMGPHVPSRVPDKCPGSRTLTGAEFKYRPATPDCKSSSRKRRVLRRPDIHQSAAESVGWPVALTGVENSVRAGFVFPICVTGRRTII